MSARIAIREIDAADEAAFVAAARASRAIHRPWVSAPRNAGAFATYLGRFTAPHSYGFVMHVAGTGELAGAINITNIIHGGFRSGYLGYFAFAGYEGRGYMQAGLGQVVRHAFTELRLHRLEANIQPANHRSIALVESCGFRKEGYSPAYLKIAGRWRDHERWAIVRGHAAEGGTIRKPAN